jgi:mono/diheme cytochrome c family protein
VKKKLVSVGCALALWTAGAMAQSADRQFAPEQIKTGASIFARNCSPCHGSRMADGQAFDLRKFPPDEKTRFVNAVTRGKNAMPPLGSLFGPDEIDALWAYVVAGEKP